MASDGYIKAREEAKINSWEPEHLVRDSEEPLEEFTARLAGQLYELERRIYHLERIADGEGESRFTIDTNEDLDDLAGRIEALEKRL